MSAGCRGTPAVDPPQARHYSAGRPASGTTDDTWRIALPCEGQGQTCVAPCLAGVRPWHASTPPGGPHVPAAAMAPEHVQPGTPGRGGVEPSGAVWTIEARGGQQIPVGVAAPTIDL